MRNEGQETLETVELELPFSLEVRAQLGAFVGAQTCAHYRQSPDWIDVDLGPRVFVSRDAAGRIVASSILSESRPRWSLKSVAEIVRGPVVADTRYLGPHLSELLGIIGTRYASLRVNPFARGAALDEISTTLRTLGFTAKGAGRFYSDTLLAPICATSDEQWRCLRRSTRTAINRGRRLGLRVALENGPEAYRAFAENFSAFAATRGLPSFTVQMAAGVQQSFAGTTPPGALLLTAYADGTPAGEALLMRNRDVLVYEWGWTAPASDRRRLPVTHNLLWWALEWGRDNGCSHLDLGGYWSSRPSTDATNQFKRGFSKTVTTYCGVFEYVCSPLAHRVHLLTNRLKVRLKGL